MAIDHWRLAVGGEVSFWPGGALKAGVAFYLWSNALRGPVNYRIREASGSVLKDWSPMQKGSGGGGTFYGQETLKPGKYEVDFRVGEEEFSALKLALR